jgi:hypothetical protein
MYFEQHRGIEREHGKQSESVLGYQSYANLVYQSLPLPSFPSCQTAGPAYPHRRNALSSVVDYNPFYSEPLRGGFPPCPTLSSSRYSCWAPTPSRRRRALVHSMASLLDLPTELLEIVVIEATRTATSFLSPLCPRSLTGRREAAKRAGLLRLVHSAIKEVVDTLVYKHFHHVVNESPIHNTTGQTERARH